MEPVSLDPAYTGFAIEVVAIEIRSLQSICGSAFS